MDCSSKCTLGKVEECISGCWLDYFVDYKVGYILVDCIAGCWVGYTVDYFVDYIADWLKEDSAGYFVDCMLEYIVVDCMVYRVCCCPSYSAQPLVHHLSHCDVFDCICWCATLVHPHLLLFSSVFSLPAHLLDSAPEQEDQPIVGWLPDLLQARETQRPQSNPRS